MIPTQSIRRDRHNTPDRRVNEENKQSAADRPRPPWTRHLRLPRLKLANHAAAVIPIREPDGRTGPCHRQLRAGLTLTDAARGSPAVVGSSESDSEAASRKPVARGYIGQHEDNEAVMRYLTDEATDLEWMVHRAGIGSDGPSRGALRRSRRWISIATFVDCAAYSLRLLDDDGAVHSCDGSAYARGR